MESPKIEKQKILEALSALAQPTRLDIFRLLVQAGDAGMPVGAIAENLGVPNATLSFHLQQLKHAELVTTERKGTTISCKANYGAMNGLIGYLTENCCQSSASEACMTGSLCCPANIIDQPDEIRQQNITTI